MRLRRLRLGDLLALGGALLLYARWLKPVSERFFERRELDALHAAWRLSQGTLPWADLATHASPLYEWMLGALAAVFEPAASFSNAVHYMLVSRYVSWLWYGLALCMLGLLAARAGGRQVAGLAVVFAASATTLSLAAMQVGPSAAALCLLCGALYLLMCGVIGQVGGQASHRCLAGGSVCLGLAALLDGTLCWAAAGSLLAILWNTPDIRERERKLGLFVLGFIAPSLLVWGWFSLHGAGQSYCGRFFGSLARPGGRDMQSIFSLSACDYLVGVLGLVGLWRESWLWWRGRAVAESRLLASTALFLLTGMVLGAAMGQQDLAPLLGLLAVLGARIFTRPLVVCCLIVALCVSAYARTGSYLSNQFQLQPMGWIMGHTAVADPIVEDATMLAPFRTHWDEDTRGTPRPPWYQLRDESAPRVVVTTGRMRSESDEVELLIKDQYLATTMSSLFPEVFKSGSDGLEEQVAHLSVLLRRPPSLLSHAVHIAQAVGEIVTPTNVEFFYSPLLGTKLKVGAGLPWPALTERELGPWMFDHADRFKDKSVLDIGTGCGIIALYARKLGARHVVGTDIDKRCIIAATENFRHAGRAEELEARLVPLDRPSAFSTIGRDEKFDVIISDVFLVLDLDAATDSEIADNGDLSLSLLQGMRQHLNPGGQTILCVGSRYYQMLLQKLALRMGFKVDVIGNSKFTSLDEWVLSNSYTRLYLKAKKLPPDFVTFEQGDFKAERLPPGAFVVISP